MSPVLSQAAIRSMRDQVEMYAQLGILVENARATLPVLPAPAAQGAAKIHPVVFSGPMIDASGRSRILHHAWARACGHPCEIARRYERDLGSRWRQDGLELPCLMEDHARSIFGARSIGYYAWPATRCPTKRHRSPP